MKIENWQFNLPIFMRRFLMRAEINDGDFTPDQFIATVESVNIESDLFGAVAQLLLIEFAKFSKSDQPINLQNIILTEEESKIIETFDLVDYALPKPMINQKNLR